MSVLRPEQTKGLKKVTVYIENKNIHVCFDFAGKRGLSLDLVREEDEKQTLEKLRKFAFEMMNNKEVI